MIQRIVVRNAHGVDVIVTIGRNPKTDPIPFNLDAYGFANCYFWKVSKGGYLYYKVHQPKEEL